MGNIENEFDSSIGEVEKYHAAGVYLGTGATYKLFDETKEEKSPAFDEEELKPRLLWGHGLQFSPETEVGTYYVFFESDFSTSLTAPTESPFEELQETFSDRGKIRQIKKIKRIIRSMLDRPNFHFAQALADRLFFLCEVVLGDPEEGSIPPESVVSFIRFLQATPNLKYPDIVLTPSNEISAQWRAGPNRHFAVVFQATGEARFVIFTPNPKNSMKIDRLYGMTSVDTLMENAKPHGVLEWVAQ